MLKGVPACMVLMRADLPAAEEGVDEAVAVAEELAPASEGQARRRGW